MTCDGELPWRYHVWCKIDGRYLLTLLDVMLKMPAQQLCTTTVATDCTPVFLPHPKSIDLIPDRLLYSCSWVRVQLVLNHIWMPVNAVVVHTSGTPTEVGMLQRFA